ncbi:Flp family type IVb pilin [Agrobacterium sp. NPDC090273]|uniref:Flp family type IVb pilin n=1 Tax=Agrobacterium sp. NPDC090273 TaxID=3363919 RepID=UPI00383AEDB2
MLDGENRLAGCFRRFLKNENGATMVEYGLITALISVGIIAGMRSIGTQIDGVFQIIIDTFAAYVS